MKKLKIFMMSIFVLALGTFLVACDLKKPEATFDKKEIVVSVNDSISLDDFLTVKGVEKKNITFKLENPDLLDLDGRTLIAGEKSGKSYVYALYKKNILASMQVVIKDKFKTPTFSDNPLSSDGVFSWNAVSGYYGNEVVAAKEYRVEGTCVVYSASDPSVVVETIDINQTVSSTNFTLSRNGVYHLMVTALGTGYFDEGDRSEEVTLSFGYVGVAENFVWDAEMGVLAWDEVQNANVEYAVKFDGVFLSQRQSETSLNLFDRLSLASAGEHTVSITTYDTSGRLLAVESETVVISKLAKPEARYDYSAPNGGRVKICPVANAKEFVVEFEDVSNSANKKTIFVPNGGENVFTTFEELDAGLYSIKIYAKPTAEGGMFFQSSKLDDFGKIYKLPTVSIEGAGGNLADGTSLGINLTSLANPVDVLLVANGLGSPRLVEGFEKGQTNFNFELTLASAGDYTISLKQIPVAEENLIDGERVFVLNSNESESLVATKVDAITGGVQHSYDADGNSVLTFAKTTFGKNYVLQVDEGSGFVDVLAGVYSVTEGENVAITLKGKIEDLFGAVAQSGKDFFKFRIVCQGAEKMASINSVTSKTIEKLQAPRTANAGNSDTKAFSWVGVSGAANYKVELYKIDKSGFDANKNASKINIQTSGLEDLGGVTSALRIDIAEVGYYYAKVFALSGDVDAYISSGEALEEVFYICEKLEVENVDLAENEKGYYLSIANGENVSGYEVFLNNVSLGTSTIASGDVTEVLLADDFQNTGTEYKISVVAHAINEEIYNASAAYEFAVERLPEVVRGDINVSDLTLEEDPATMQAKNTKQEISINAITGARGVRIWDGSGTSAGSETEKSARLSIATKSNPQFYFRYFGSETKDGVFVKEANKIFLTGKASSFTFTRLQTPTNLAYYAGKLRFDHTATTSTDFYVLNIVCVGLNKKAENILVKLSKTVTAQYASTVQELGKDSDFVLPPNGNVVTIDFEKVIEKLQTIPAFANVYNQSANVGFAVYAFQDRTEVGATMTSVTICSDFATTNLDNSKIVCVVEKMPQTSLEIDLDTSATDYILTWSPVKANPSYESETKYQVLINGEEVAGIDSALSKSFSRSDFDDATYYEFSVVAQNPYYVQSDTSNIVRVFKLASISSLKLFEDGKLGYDLSSAQKDFVDFVKVTSTSSVDNNRSGKIDITEEGNLTLKVVGKKAVETEGNKKTYYIDSDETSWNLAQMSTLKPADETVKYENNTISWNAFATTENLQCLRYVLMFVDENGNVATFKTTSTSENLTTNTDLYNTLDALSGEVTIYVSAYLETFPVSGSASDKATYTVAAGKTIYHAGAAALPVGTTQCNFYVYGKTATVNKFETPNITKVDFTSTDLSDANLPNMVVEFVGNFGMSRDFDIYLGGEYYVTKTLTRNDNKYQFTLAPEDYNSKVGKGETLTIGVCALSETDILSSIGTVTIVRNEDLDAVAFAKNAANELSHTLVLLLPENGTSGGVVVRVVYQETDEDEKEEYVLVPVSEILTNVTYDLSDLLNKTVDGKKILAKGGTVKLFAHVASFSGSGEYYLACPTWTESETYNILAGVDEVQKTSGGFAIDAQTNSTDTTYVVKSNNTTFEVTCQDGEFRFEFPHGGQWTNGTYDLEVYAKQNGFLPSVTTHIEFVLNKLGAIADVKILREQDDLSAIKLSWDAVADATGYVFRMYAANDSERTNLLYEYVEDRKVSSNVITTCTLLDMFGQGYAKLLEFGKLDAFALMTDTEVVFDVFVRGKADQNDSDTFTFGATIKGNAFEISDFEVNEHGYIVLHCVPEKTYLYRFVTSDGTVLLKWTKLVAKSDFEKIDTKGITAMGGTYFNMEVVAVGDNLSEEISTKLEGLVVDSIVFTTYGTGTTFVVGTDIVKVGYIESENSTDLSFELVTGSYSKLFVGLSEDALLSGQVAEFVPNFVAQGSSNGQEICSFNLSILVDRLKQKGLSLEANNADITLYFWAFRMTDAGDLENSFCISHASTVAFEYTNQIDFVEIKKLGTDLADTSRFMEDYANSFAIFENNDASQNKMTLGIYVKITPISDPSADVEEEVREVEEISQTFFVDRATLLGNNYFTGTNLFVINLTEIFERSEFASLYGRFRFEFATLSVKEVGAQKQFVLSDWTLGANGKEFVLEKLRDIDSLELRSGNLTWINREESSQKYYVYFVDRLGADGGLGDSFVYAAVTTNKYVASYNASDFVGLGQGYFLAVRAVNEDAYVLPSQIKFVTSGGEKIRVEKNEIKSPLKIENGKLFIPFVKGDDESLKIAGEGRDFVDYIRNCSESTDAVDRLLGTTFKVPFTFKLEDLVSGKIFVRLRFTSLSNAVQGKSQTFDVDARNLISSILDIDEDFDYLDKLNRLERHVVTGGAALRSFISLMKNETYGIGTHLTLFDDRFESLQSGEYKLEYCLLGELSLTSGWYSYNNNGQNSLYVNNEPEVEAIKTSAIGGFNSANSYRLLVKKSEVFSKNGTELTKELSDRYVLKIYNEVGLFYAFSISKNSTSYSLTMLNGKDGTSVTVYEVDRFGKEQTDGECLLLYINQNGGNSILGRFGDEIEKGTYKMQIFAIGNDYSLSSKSNVFNLVLHGFGTDFTLNNGQFTWTTRGNAKATVIYKKNSSQGETVSDVPIETTAMTARYSLDETGAGLYDYVDFLVIGDVNGNNIEVDSEVYRVENVYKLADPILSNVNGFIQIDDTQNAMLEGLDGCYSDLNFYNYKIYNNVSTANEFLRLVDDHGAQEPILYEAGTTGVSQISADYAYKSTEESASTFFVASVGSTAEFDIRGSEEEATYYLKTLSFKNNSALDFGEGASVGVAVRSNFTPLEAKMLDKTSGLNIRNGLLTWNPVTGRSSDDLALSPSEKVVYKISVVQYDISYSDSGEVENEYPNLLEFFTLETEFDFARIDEDKLNKSARYMKATVQAFAMNISSNIPAFPTYLQLVEGGYAYGNVKFASSDSYVLMGDGGTIRSIERSQSIEDGSLKVVDGSLIWTVLFDTPVTASADFANSYKFSVVDENFKEIEGDFTFEQGESDRQVKVTFAERKGQLLEKTQVLTVYMTKLEGTNAVIKSFGKEIEITKLGTIYSNNYTITSDEKDSNVEVVDFSEYFADNPANEVELSIYQNTDKSDIPVNIIFTAKRCKFYILGQPDDGISGNEPGFAGKFVVGQDSKLIMNFKVRNTSLANCLYSDMSDDIILQRSSWGDGEITWVADAQRFEWTYGGFNALGEKVDVDQIEKIFQTNKEALLFVDSTLETGAFDEDVRLSIPQGLQVLVTQVSETASSVELDGKTYYMKNEDYGDAIKVVQKTTLAAGTLFRVVENLSETQTIIKTEDDRLFVISADLVVEPVYIVEAIYGEGASQIVRTYTTTDRFFTPTVIGKVTIRVKIKLGESNVQSQALEYKGGQKVNFNLFSAGQGTSQSPYLIADEAQFKNMTFRLSKDKTLTKYIESGNIKTEEEKYYFSLQSDISFSSALKGLLFEGAFTGELRGNKHTLTYENSAVSKLSQGREITISEGNVVSATDNVSTTIYYGGALFEALASTAVVKDLNLNVTLKQSSASAYITRNSLISGLAITNSGKIENVNLTGFSSNFVGLASSTTRLMMIYSGIVSINTGRDALITGCSMDTNMTFNDFSRAQLIFVGGIAFTNYATIDACTAGSTAATRAINVIGLNESDVVQVAGIAVTNASYSTLSNCHNYANITVSAQDNNDNFVVYLAGIADLANGTVQDNQNHGVLTATNILPKNLHKGEIFANEA